MSSWEYGNLGKLNDFGFEEKGRRFLSVADLISKKKGAARILSLASRWKKEQQYGSSADVHGLVCREALGLPVFARVLDPKREYQGCLSSLSSGTGQRLQPGHSQPDSSSQGQRTDSRRLAKIDPSPGVDSVCALVLCREHFCLFVVHESVYLLAHLFLAFIFPSVLPFVRRCRQYRIVFSSLACRKEQSDLSPVSEQR